MGKECKLLTPPVSPSIHRPHLQGTSKKRFPGCVNFGEKVAFCLPTAGKRAQFFHPIFTQPRKHSLEVPCIPSSPRGKFICDLGNRSWRMVTPNHGQECPPKSPYRHARFSPRPVCPTSESDLQWTLSYNNYTSGHCQDTKSTYQGAAWINPRHV